MKGMNNQTMKEFYVIGIAIRTINQNGQAAIDLEALWGRFWGENVSNQIPNKVSEEIYAIYTDYETDYTGYYTTIIGLPVSSLDYIPEGFVGITINETVYEKYVSKGKMPDAVFQTWLSIWADPELNERRAYRADFTVHDQRYHHGENAEVETYISVL